MWLWTQSEAKRIDDRTLALGIPAAELMEKAGQRSAQKILKLAPDAHSAVVLCGPGHNGGDGQIVARELQKHEIKTTVFRLPDQATDFLHLNLKADLWIDALFGIGLNRNLAEPFLSVIHKFNQSRGLRIALDTPSGLNVDTGTIWRPSIRADHTLTVGHPKPGFYLNRGPEHTGLIHCIDVDFPKPITHSEARSVYLFNSRLLQKWLPVRQATDHKNKGGRSLIWAGSRSMPGAALLAARAASRVGSGYVYTTESQVLKYHPETILWPQKDLSNFTAALIGPGLGVNKKTEAALKRLKRQEDLPVVIDADALTVAARKKLFPFPSNWIATPHAGELARFLGGSAFEIENNSLQAARRAQTWLGCTVILKGYHTVVATPSISLIIPTGNVALAKGGTGDVLAGMITGFLSQGLSSERAALVACYIHGWMADQWIQSGRDFLSLTPSDLIEQIPQALARLRRHGDL